MKKLTIKEAQARPCPECGAVKKSPCVDLPRGKVYRSTVHDKRMEGESHHRP